MHPTAKAGYQDAFVYDRYRPDYQVECVDYVLEIGGLSKMGYRRPCILELGAGTGKFTEKFLERCKQNVHFVGLDPNTVFLDHLRQKNLSIETMPSMADNIMLADDSVDFALAAQSFHWFANRKSLAEIHRVLKDGAKFVVLWVLPNGNLPWQRNLTAFFNETFKIMNTPTPTSYEWKEAFQDSLDLFTPLQEPHTYISLIKFTVHEYLSYFMTLSIFASQTDDEKKSSEKRLLDIISDAPNFEEMGGAVIPFHTEIYCVSKI